MGYGLRALLCPARYIEFFVSSLPKNLRGEYQVILLRDEGKNAYNLGI